MIPLSNGETDRDAQRRNRYLVRASYFPCCPVVVGRLLIIFIASSHASVACNERSRPIQTAEGDGPDWVRRPPPTLGNICCCTRTTASFLQGGPKSWRSRLLKWCCCRSLPPTGLTIYRLQAMILIIPVVSGLMWNCLAEGATRRPTQLNANIRYETATLLSCLIRLSRSRGSGRSWRLQCRG